MKTYKETDTLSELRVGDILEMNDGTKHIANGWRGGCRQCSLYQTDFDCKLLDCINGDFHFKKLTK